MYILLLYRAQSVLANLQNTGKKVSFLKNVLPFYDFLMYPKLGTRVLAF